MQFRGRSITTLNDLSLDEQLFLYKQTRWLKDAMSQKNVAAGDAARSPLLASYRVEDDDVNVYMIFMEESTRTKESFLNATNFHNIEVQVVDINNSAYVKGETIADTLRMLCGYSVGQSVFVMRTKLEGVCTAMRDTIGDYCDKMGLPRASFINAGDGKHSHPTHELADQFTFLEHNNWDRSRIHVALVGDLQLSRTAHSKVYGLKIYKSVKVDLIAPSELQMPSDYVDEMRRNGYTVRTYTSIDEYVSLGKDHVAPMWYFTRLQLERHSDDLLAHETRLRRAITFREEFYSKIDDSRTKFFYTLPRQEDSPEIPPYLDSTPLNGWEQQSMNGYFTRIIELAMVMGKFDSTRDDVRLSTRGSKFVSPVVAKDRKVPHRWKDPTKLQIKPVCDGVVIDHIGSSTATSEADIWHQMQCIRRCLQLYTMSAQGVFQSGRSRCGLKGVMSFPNLPREYFSMPRLKMLAAIAPGCILSIIRSDLVFQKFELKMPPRIYKLPALRCRNPRCISNPSAAQMQECCFVHDVAAVDENSNADALDHGRMCSTSPSPTGDDVVRFRCKFCETPHNFLDIWS